MAAAALQDTRLACPTAAPLRRPHRSCFLVDPHHVSLILAATMVGGHRVGDGSALTMPQPKRKQDGSDSDEFKDTKKQKAAAGAPREKKDWTKGEGCRSCTHAFRAELLPLAEEELALLRAVFETALTMVPALHEKSGLKGKRGNPSVSSRERCFAILC